MQPVRCDPVERGVVQDDDAVCALRQSLQRQEGVVGLHHNVRHHVGHGLVGAVLLVGEHTVRLDEFLRVSVRGRIKILRVTF